MNHRRHILLLALAAICPATPVYHVAAVGGTHSSLQAAVDACPATGCRIELTDSVYTFTEPVSIRGKDNLSIVGTRADGSSPRMTIAPGERVLAPIPSINGYAPTGVIPVLWTKASVPDTLVNPDASITERKFDLAYGPAGQAAKFLLHQGRDWNGNLDARRPAGWLLAPFPSMRPSGFSQDDLETGYLHAGLLMIETSRNILVEGLDFELNTPLDHVLQGVWAGRFSGISALAAVNLFNSLNATIRRCHFSGWGIGIRGHDRNTGGIVTDLMGPLCDPASDLCAITRPLSDPGKTGGHRIEDNTARGNRTFIHWDVAWDLATTIRFNRMWENGMERLVADVGLRKSIDPEYRHRGGAIDLHDVFYPSFIVQGNTFQWNSFDLHSDGWRVSRNHLFFDNLAERPLLASASSSELTSLLGANRRNNWIVGRNPSGSNSTIGASTTDSTFPFCSNKGCDLLVPAWGAAIIDANLVGKGYFGDDLGAVWSTPRTPERIRIQDQTLALTTFSDSNWRVVLPLPVEAATSVGTLKVIKAFAQVVKGTYYQQESAEDLIELDGLAGTALNVGVNLLSFEIPAARADSVWRVEMAVQGTDMNTGKMVHSNLGTWLVRPLGKQLQVTQVDDGEVQPGSTVRFQVKVIDSLGNASSLGTAPSLNARGWSLAPAIAGRVAGRAGASSTFEVSATAPAEPGLSQVVFWGIEDGRVQAVPGAAYVQVGARASGIGTHRVTGSNWSLGGLAKRPQGWTVQVKGATATELAKARLLDPRGHTWSVGTSGTALSLPALPAGTYFLNLGGKSRSLALIP